MGHRGETGRRIIYPRSPRTRQRQIYLPLSGTTIFFVWQGNGLSISERGANNGMLFVNGQRCGELHQEIPAGFGSGGCVCVCVF